MTLAQVEAVVGTSDREWYTPLGVRYRLYRYDAGIAPDKADAGAILFLDVISLGMIEVMEAVSEGGFTAEPHEFQDLAVAYDTHDVAIGVFTDVGPATVLPEDGRNPGP
jgi:hypothetical protein